VVEGDGGGMNDDDGVFEEVGVTNEFEGVGTSDELKVVTDEKPKGMLGADGRITTLGVNVSLVD
jgi:hypothetical protein